MIAADTLLEESKCYLCLGISQAQGMILALENRIAGGVEGTQEMVLTGDGLMGAITADVVSSTGFWAIEDSNNVVTIFPNGAGSTAAGVSSATIWPCLSATSDSNFGSLTSVSVPGPQIGGTLDATLLIGLTSLSCPGNQINSLLVGGLTSLTNVEASNNILGEAEVDAVLVALNASGASNGVVDLSTNTAPGAAGLAAAASLTGKGWTVTHD